MPPCASPKAAAGPIRISRDDLAAILGAAAVRERGGDAHQRARRRDRPRLDAGRRRHPVHRGDAHSRRRPADPHRPARRRDEGKRAGGARRSSRTAPPRSASMPARFEKSDIHVHVPAGAIPKDGPSAGVAMFMALVSLMTDRTIRSDTAMTGEISLRGLVLPVGGIKEKVVAAHSAGIKRVMLPARNRRDYRRHPRRRAPRDGVHLARARRRGGRGRARAEEARRCAGVRAATRRRRRLELCARSRWTGRGGLPAGILVACAGAAHPHSWSRWRSVVENIAAKRFLPLHRVVSRSEPVRRWQVGRKGK